MKLEWPALRSLNFRYFLAGQAISLLGNAIQQLALMWLVYRMSHSAMILGVMGFVSGLPAALISPLGGVMADRMPPHRVVVATQILAALQAFALALLVYLQRVDVPAIVALVCLQGIINGIDTPVRQMFVGRLVDHPQDIGSAVASNSIVYDAARLIGPAFGGFLLAHFAEGPAFFTNGICHAVVVGLFLRIRLPAPSIEPVREGVVETLCEGVRHAMSHGGIRVILLLSACVSFAGSGYMVLTPLMAADVLQGGPESLGYLMSAVGAGAIAGALLFSVRFGASGHARLIGLGALLFGISLVVFSQSRVLVVSVGALSVAGFGIMVMMAACNTLLFRLTEAKLHGRILSLFTLSFLGSAPLGSLCAGYVADRVGAPATIGAGGFLAVAAALLFSTQLPALARQIPRAEAAR